MQTGRRRESRAPAPSSNPLPHGSPSHHPKPAPYFEFYQIVILLVLLILTLCLILFLSAISSSSTQPENEPPPFAESSLPPTFKSKIIKMILKERSKERLAALVQIFNRELPIMNQDTFVLEPNYIPILLVVHKRTSYLRQTINLLRNNTNISKTLLIISHDGLFDEVFSLIETIDFCQVKQLLFPFNWDYMIRTNQVTETGLQYGENHGTLKLHWLWIQVQARKWIVPHAGDIAYTEDDFWPTPDYYESLKRMRDVRNKNCPKCFGSTVGDHPPDWMRYLRKLKKPFDQVNKITISCPKNSMSGLALPQGQWDKFIENVDQFCDLDNNHWDDPIHAMMHSRAIEPMLLHALYPRTLHVGRCGGLHFRNSDPESCNAENDIKEFIASFVEPWHKDVERHGYPSKFIEMTPTELAEQEVRCRNKYSVKGVGVSRLKEMPVNYKATCNGIARNKDFHLELASIGRTKEEMRRILLETEKSVKEL